MKLIAIESSMVCAVGYDEPARELEVVFADGSIWRYCDLPAWVYDDLIASASIGRYLRTYVIGIYPEYRIRRKPA